MRDRRGRLRLGVTPWRHWAARPCPAATAASTHDRVPWMSTRQPSGARHPPRSGRTITDAGGARGGRPSCRMNHASRTCIRGCGLGRAARRQYHRRAGHGWSAARPHFLAGAALVTDRISGRATEHRRVRDLERGDRQWANAPHRVGMAPDEIDAIEQSGEPRRLVTVVAPRSGVVVNRGG